jgi:hypothetical protein
VIAPSHKLKTAILCTVSRRCNATLLVTVADIPVYGERHVFRYG